MNLISKFQWLNSRYCLIFIVAQILILILYLNFFEISKYTNQSFMQMKNLLDITSSNSENESQKVKYVEYLCEKNFDCGGFADRLKGMLSVYAWSLLTNRSLILNMNTPCDLDKILLPNKVNWLKNKTNLTGLTNTEFVYYYQFNLKYFEKENILQLSKSDVITIKTGMFIMNSFGKNPHLQPIIKKLGYEPEKFKLHHLIYDWYKTLFRLNENMQREYEEFLNKTKKHLNHKLICAQVRLGGQTHGSNADMPFASGSNSIEYWNFINKTFIPKLNDSDYMIYVTSDSDNVKNEAKKFFGSDRVIVFYDSNYHINLDLKNRKDSCEKMEKIILEFHYLQECDMAVVSHSGFGLLGTWNRKIPNKDLYAYTNQEIIKKNYWDRRELQFVKIDNLDEFHFLK